jgi:hypothetical protein
VLLRDLPQEDDEIQDYTFCWTFVGQGDENPDFPIPVIPYGPPWIDTDLRGPICEVEADGTPLEWREGDRLLLHFWLYGDIRNELIFYQYGIAARIAEGDCLMSYRGDNTVYYPYETGWELITIDVTEPLLESAAGGTITGASVMLNVVDMCPFWCDVMGDGDYHTPDPYFDNVRVMVLRDQTGVGETPAATALLGAYPNPFNPSTRIRFSLAEGADVTLRVLDVSGRVLRTLAVGRLEAGEHERVWDGRDDAGAPQASGVYLVDFRAGTARERAKLVLLK